MTIIQRLITRLTALLRTPSAMVCGDCPRNARCGLPPSDDCVVRLEMAERAGELRPST